MERDRRISDILQQFKTNLERDSIQLGELLEALKDRGPFFIITVLSVPFLQPIALPGVSVPFGILIAVLALGTALEREMRLPKRILRYKLHPKGVSLLFRGAIALFRKLERWSKPRLENWVEREWVRRFHSMLIVVNALLLTLPLPIPFSNSLPAYTAFFISIGYLQRDGAMMIAGYVSALFTFAYFALIWLLGMEGFRLLLRTFMAQ